MCRGLFHSLFMKVTSRHSFTLSRPFLWKKPLFRGVNDVTKCPKNVPPCIVKFHGLLKPIFHTIYQSNGTQGGVQIIKMEILMNFFHKGGRGSRVPFTYFFGNGFLAKKKHFSAKLKNGCFSVNPAGNWSVVIFGPKYASLGTYRPCRLIWCPVG